MLSFVNSIYEQRAQFRSKLGNLFDYMFRGNGNCCNFNTYNSFPLRTTAPGVLIHDYFSLLKYYVATADEDTHAATFWSDASYNLGGTMPRTLSQPPNGRCVVCL